MLWLLQPGPSAGSGGGVPDHQPGRQLDAERLQTPLPASGWRTVVRAGTVIAASMVSSKPTTETSAGTRRTRADAACSAPTAMLSLNAKIAVGGSGRPSRRAA